MDTFKRSDAIINNSRTLLYGPVAASTTAIVFAGVFSNIDTTNKSQHKLTLEIRLSDETTYFKQFQDIPIEYGGSSKCPKIALATGESVYGTADANSSISASLNILERT